MGLRTNGPAHGQTYPSSTHHTLKPSLLNPSTPNGIIRMGQGFCLDDTIVLHSVLSGAHVRPRQPDGDTVTAASRVRSAICGLATRRRLQNRNSTVALTRHPGTCTTRQCGVHRYQVTWKWPLARAVCYAIE